MMRSIQVLTLFLGAALVLPAQAGTLVSPGVYTLSNHPNGNARPPLYGFRLDELYDDTTGHDIYTFDFDHALSSMTLTYDGSSIVIDGTSWGGRDIGDEYDAATAGLWDINFTFLNVVGVPGDDDLIVYTPQVPNTGTITRLSDNDVINLWDYPGNNDHTFRLGNENDDQGHRGHDGISGWGWVNHGTNDVHYSASDWLFTAQPIPEPATCVLLLTGAVACVLRKSRRVR